jgi:hypothetical protein
MTDSHLAYMIRDAKERGYCYSDSDDTANDDSIDNQWMKALHLYK